MVANGRQGSPRFKGWLRWVKRVKRFFEKSAFWDRLITIPIEAFSLLGRLEGLGTGGAVALNRRSFAAQQEQMWSRQRQAHAICVKQGRDLLRRGQFRQVSCETSLFLVFVLFFYFGFWSFLFWYFVYIFLFSFSGANPIPTFVVNCFWQICLFLLFCTASIMACFAQWNLPNIKHLTGAKDKRGVRDRPWHAPWAFRKEQKRFSHGHLQQAWRGNCCELFRQEIGPKGLLTSSFICPLAPQLPSPTGAHPLPIIKKEKYMGQS